MINTIPLTILIDEGNSLQTDAGYVPIDLAAAHTFERLAISGPHRKKPYDHDLLRNAGLELRELFGTNAIRVHRVLRQGIQERIDQYHRTLIAWFEASSRTASEGRIQ